MRKNILLQAPVFSISGYGAHARDIALSLLKDNRFNVSIKQTGWGGSSTGEFFDKETMNNLTFGTNNKLRDEKDSIFIHLGIPTEFQVRSKYNVGITAGLEATRITRAWVDSCNKMDLVVVPSKFISDIFVQSGVTSSLLVVPEGINASLCNSPLSTVDMVDMDKLPTKFNFLSVGQWINYSFGKDRKQVALLIDTFMKTFEGDETVGLVLKTYTNNISTPDMYFTVQKVEEVLRGRKGPKIYLLHGELTDMELLSLYKSPNVHAYVSMTSGEGWNRPVAEAAACGLPVVITGWSGHMDFLQKEYASFIEYELKDVPPEVIQSGDYFEQGMKWAYPKVEDTIVKMKDMRDNYSLWKEKSLVLSKIMCEKYNKDIIYAQLNDVLAKFNFSDETQGALILMDKV